MPDEECPEDIEERLEDDEERPRGYRGAAPWRITRNASRINEGLKDHEHLEDNEGLDEHLEDHEHLHPDTQETEACAIINEQDPESAQDHHEEECSDEAAEPVEVDGLEGSEGEDPREMSRPMPRETCPAAEQESKPAQE